MKNTNVRQGGFTLVELVVVIVILGILFALGVNGLTAYRTSMALNDAISSVSQAFSSASRTVRTKSRVSTVTFYPSTRSVRVTSNGTVLENTALQLDSLTVNCRPTCATFSVDLTSPGGELQQDLSFTIGLRGKIKTFKVVGPSAMEVRL